MDLSARDVHEKQFHDAWRGYNQEEVDDFLDKVAAVVDRLQRENDSLRSRISDLDQVVVKSREAESMLKKTLVSAQKAAEDALQTAKARAEQLIGEADERMKRANEEARERVRAAEEEARRKTEVAERKREEKTAELDSSIERLTAYEKELKKRLRAFLEDEIKTLDALNQKRVSTVQPKGDDQEPPDARQAQQPRPSGQRLHAAPASSYRERESARPSPRQQPEPRGARPEPVDEMPEPAARRRRPAEDPQHRRGGLRGFFWGDPS